ncbi:S8 family serine peptidase [Deinococcus sp. YIM 134068]|uniref:S8 family serine peptidase n=1 Tax=Deinococcus lichenicola TaxID=3118910 RepID=UPI002F9547AD
MSDLKKLPLALLVLGLAAWAGGVQTQPDKESHVFQGEVVPVSSLEEEPPVLKVGGKRGPACSGTPRQWTCAVPKDAALGEQDVSLVRVKDGKEDVLGTWVVLPGDFGLLLQTEQVKPTSLSPSINRTASELIVNVLPRASASDSSISVEEVNNILNREFKSPRRLQPFDIRERQLNDGSLLFFMDELEQLPDGLRGTLGDVSSPLTVNQFSPIRGLPQINTSRLPIWQLPLNQGIRRSIKPPLNSNIDLSNLKARFPSLFKDRGEAGLGSLINQLKVPTLVFQPNDRVINLLRKDNNSPLACTTPLERFTSTEGTSRDIDLLRKLFVSNGLASNIIATREPNIGDSPSSTAHLNKSDEDKLNDIDGAGVNRANAEAIGSRETASPSQQPIIYVVDTFGKDKNGVMTDRYAVKRGIYMAYGHGEYIGRILKMAYPEAADVQYIPACDADGSCETALVIQGICQAVAARKETKRPVIVNLSLSTPLPGQYLLDAMKYAARNGVLFVAGHGNVEDQENQKGYSCYTLVAGDRCHHFPADWSAQPSLPLSLASSIVSVGALEWLDDGWQPAEFGRLHEPGGRLAPGVLNVPADVLAPSRFYFESRPPNQVTQQGLQGLRLVYRGTSFATPLVTGLLAQRVAEGQQGLPKEWDKITSEVADISTIPSTSSPGASISPQPLDLTVHPQPQP